MNIGVKAVALVAALVVLPAQAAVIQVAPAEVAVSINQLCSLHEAVNNAQSGTDTSSGDCTAGTSGPDVIELAEGSTYILVRSGTSFNDDRYIGVPRIRSEVIIEGNGAVLLGNRPSSNSDEALRHFLVLGDGSLTLRDATLRDGIARVSNARAGGAIFNNGQLVLERVLIEDCEAFDSGGGIHNNGTLTLRDSTIRNTISRAAGGAIVNRGTMTIERSLIEGGSSVGAGGGIDAGGSRFSAGNFTNTLSNSTVSGNEAAGVGGGIYGAYGALITATQVTIAYNAGTTPAYDGGVLREGHEDAGRGSGIYMLTNRNDTVVLENTLLGEQVNGDNCGVQRESSGTAGTISHEGTVADDDSCTGIGPSASPLIDVLAENGGPTRTHALTALSAAIDAGMDLGATSTDTDQRGTGFSRVIGAQIDVGAFEYGDSDGVELTAEDSVPNPDGGGTGDGNGDGIMDSQQSSVASFNAALGSAVATIQSGGETKPLSSVSSQPAPDDAPKRISFPYGFFNFTILNVEPGATEQVVLYVPSNSAINGYWKKSTTGVWANIATSVTQDGNKTRVVFPLTEGGLYDFDSDNTTITDPGGPGILDTTPIPALSRWAVVMLSMMLGLAAMIVLRKRLQY